MAATETAPAANADAAVPAKKSPGVMMPLLAVFVLMPALAYGLTEYVLIPKLRAVMPAAGGANAEAGARKEGAGKTAAASEGEHAAPKKVDAEAVKKAGEGGAEATFEFKDIIVNLSGALGTRYLKSSFTVTGSTSKLPDIIKANHQKLLDLAIGVLSSRTINDLDNPAAKNALREELMAKFNHALGVEMIEELYFSEFVIQ